jgi:purine-binding chemotaxis protein CheW
MSQRDTTTLEASVQDRADELAGKYLTFRLGGEEFGLGILKVQEIIKMMDITRVPRTPAFMRGVINLRGKVVPVVDLRTKFEMDATESNEKTCIIVVQVGHHAGHLIMGLIVDEVSEVLDIPAEQIEPPPEFGATVDTTFLLGLGKLDRKVVMLLDVDTVLSVEEIESVREN